ncbi:hypothetical protein JK167_11685 [Levilactobacillus brevis]|uniref:IrrE N-terminal-like domain-containing protein n=1 Tax=Levilactobacillus brevis TaxID=1580 RepID=A0AA41JUA9_LEVBR|nr:hypothetical protein [Levilactobacillus brevis]MBS0948338.1 hypothetical protein [Levilactobacillus brevis]MBS1011483.1 hypothetical protein [Levilactobacillus brevis]
MLFDTLDSALADIDKSSDYNLDRLIRNYDIDCRYEYLPNDIHGYSMPLTRTMFINNSLEFPDLVKAHELIHCLIDDSAEPLIESSYVSNSKIEGRADHGALYLMIKEYITLTGIEPEDFNVLNFCNQCRVPAKYVFQSANAAESALDITIPDSTLYR